MILNEYYELKEEEILKEEDFWHYAPMSWSLRQIPASFDGVLIHDFLELVWYNRELYNFYRKNE